MNKHLQISSPPTPTFPYDDKHKVSYDISIKLIQVTISISPFYLQFNYCAFKYTRTFHICIYSILFINFSVNRLYHGLQTLPITLMLSLLKAN